MNASRYSYAVAAQALTAAAALGREIVSRRETYKGSTPPLASNGRQVRLGRGSPKRSAPA